MYLNVYLDVNICVDLYQFRFYKLPGHLHLHRGIRGRMFTVNSHITVLGHNQLGSLERRKKRRKEKQI